MIAAREFIDLVPSSTPAENGGGQPEAPAVITDRLEAGWPNIIPARGGVARTARLAAGDRLESEIITAARPVVIKEILALLGKDVPSPRLHGNYLMTLPFADLCARRDQLLVEHNQELKREELNRQPELPVRAQRQMRIRFGGRP